MEIKTEDYRINYDNKATTIYCQGSLRLNGMEEYAPIATLFNEIAELAPPLVILDLRKLAFLNSSGISVLSKFVIRIRQKKHVQMVVQGSQQIPWQEKSLSNLQKLMPSLKLEWQ